MEKMRKLLFVIHPLPQGDYMKPPGTCLKQSEVVHRSWVVKFCSIRGHWVLMFYFCFKTLINILLGSTMAKRTMKCQRTYTGFKNHESFIAWKVFGINYHYIFTCFFCLFLGISCPVHDALSDQSGLTQQCSPWFRISVESLVKGRVHICFSQCKWTLLP